jgi:hypothetical protein
MALGSTQLLTEMVRLTALPTSRADCHEIWESQPPGTLRACQASTRIALLLPIPCKVYKPIYLNKQYTN